MGPDRARMLTTFLDNHDVPRFLSEAGALDAGEAARRETQGLVALFTLPGIPQLYAGDDKRVSVRDRLHTTKLTDRAPPPPCPHRGRPP